jgi:hypothetical protein
MPKNTTIRLISQLPFFIRYPFTGILGVLSNARNAKNAHFQLL